MQQHELQMPPLKSASTLGSQVIHVADKSFWNRSQLLRQFLLSLFLCTDPWRTMSSCEMIAEQITLGGQLAMLLLQELIMRRPLDIIYFCSLMRTNSVSCITMFVACWVCWFRCLGLCLLIWRLKRVVEPEFWCSFALTDGISVRIADKSLWNRSQLLQSGWPWQFLLSFFLWYSLLCGWVTMIKHFENTCVIFYCS